MDSPSPSPHRPDGIGRTSHLAMAGSGHCGAMSEQAGARGDRDGRGACGQPQLGQDVRHEAMHGMRADHQALSDLRVAETLRDQPEHLPLPRTELTQRIGASPARGCGRPLDPEKRGDNAQDSITVTVPRQVGIPRQRHQVGVREQRGDLACAAQPHRAVALTMHGQRRRTNLRQLVAHVGLVDQREQIGSDVGVGRGTLGRGEGRPILR